MVTDFSLLDSIISGRVEPHIYAFTTNTIPDYMKIGDTYRPVSLRLQEWKKYFPELIQQFEKKAMVDNDKYFRDYSVHQYLETNLQKERLKPEQIADDVYYSNEFFKNTTTTDVELAMKDIQDDYQVAGNKYQFYSLKESAPIHVRYPSEGIWNPRPNQKKAIETFQKAVQKGRTNLLMYAVMRFGKSFTSLCCAKEIEAKLVLVVSGKADVKEEWRKTVESADNFSEYEFYSSEDLQRNYSIIQTTLERKEGRNKVVLFLTLQDLQGSEIKDRHQQIFGKQIDLLIVDETHFGARAEKYGAVLKDPLFKGEKLENGCSDDCVDTAEASRQIKLLNAKIRLHLSGTPYRILMGGEFLPEDIITFCQFSDIIKEQEKWDKENILNDGYKEWDNPYYGFPQMIRFAFNPSMNTMKRLDELRKTGVSYAFSALFKPLSVKKSTDNNHKKFRYEKEILELLEVIDGSKEDSNVLGFLDYPKIKTGKMCHHIVFVLPFRASCDAIEELIKQNSREFKNLNTYEILNISGIDQPNKYKDTKAVREAIQKCEDAGKKTITLTVNRMLTGSTVPEWDSMVYLKDTSSPQEYDQAIFRLQNQYIKKYDSKDGDTIQINMKPQTLLIDFDPNRMFRMQELKAQIYNVNTDESGNSKLEKRINEELRISPIIVINKEKIQQVTASNILQAVSNYSQNRGIAEETREIPVDLTLMNISEIWDTVSKENEIGSKAGFSIKANDGEETDLEIGDDNGTAPNATDNTAKPQSNCTAERNDNTRIIINQFRMYFSRVLFYAFLTKNTIHSLEDILDSLSTSENQRIFCNLGLNKTVIDALLKNMDKFMLREFDYTIQRISILSHDDSLPPLERALIANRKFGQISESEVVTPVNISNTVISLLSDNFFHNAVKSNQSILDIASKEGEMAIALCKRFETLGYTKKDYSNLIYSIPTSSITYEFTKKVYEILGLNINNLANNFTSFFLFDKTNENNEVDYKRITNFLRQKKTFSSFNENVGEAEMIKFGAVVGNPPYQEETKTSSKKNGQNPRTNIFHHFQLVAEMIASDYTSLIFPGIRWIHQSGKGLKEFGKNLINSSTLEKLLFYPNAKEVFENSGIADGISIVAINKKKTSNSFSYGYISNNREQYVVLENPGNDLLVINPSDIKIVERTKAAIQKLKIGYLSDRILSRSLFGIESDFIETCKDKTRDFICNEQIDYSKEIKLFTNDKSGSAGRTKWFVVPKDCITSGTELVNEWQVVVSSAHPGGQEGRDNQIEIIDNHSAFGRARVALASFKTKHEAENFFKYVQTDIIRFLFLMTDESLTSLGKRVPDIGDYSNSCKYLDFSKDLNSQLASLFNLTLDDCEYIKTRINR